MLTASPRAFAQASEADRATARSLAREGHDALLKKDYALAEDRFRRADQLVHAPSLVVDHARALVGLGRLVEAHERYALVLWYPGEHLLTMPGPVVVKRDGSSDTLPPSSVRVRVTSVLPAGAQRVTLPPRPARAPVSLADRSLLPLAAILLLIVLLWGVIAWLWRRRGPLPSIPSSGPAVQKFHDPETLHRWTAAGEHRVALDGWGWILARRLAESRDLEETGRIQKVLDEIADSVFSPRGPDYFAALCRRAEEAATG